MGTNKTYTGLEVAIIGMSCRFPGASNWQQYWENLVNGVESIHFFSEKELLERGVDSFKSKDPDYVKVGGKLDGKDYFDSSFFEYRPDETKLLNPLHRVFHECLWEALEDAGCNPDTAKGLISLYTGAGYDIFWRMYSSILNIDQISSKFMLHFLNNKDYMASLLAYKLNLKGAAYVIDTACSTSLVAIHMACRSLLMGESRTALAGAISLKTRKVSGQYAVKGGIVSRDGHCRAFDKDADGTVEAEGTGVVVLKRLKDAIADRDHIYAVIKGSATNNDGVRKVGYTAPSVEGQSDCIKQAHAFSKVTPESITYVETHGTGTRLGDPIEIHALNKAFGKTGHLCAIGSVKTNIGHTDTAAGVAGLIKTALSLKYKMIPPSLNFKEANPEVDLASGPFYVNTRLKKWMSDTDLPLRAGVSSFGIGGTNAHAVLEEAPEEATGDKGRTSQLLTLSAKTEAALSRYMQDLSNFIQRNPGLDLPDMCYSLQTGRKHFAYCLSFTFDSREELIAKLDSSDQKEKTRKRKERIHGLTFLFPNEDFLYGNCTAQLYTEEADFRKEMDKGFAALRELTGTSFQELLYANKPTTPYPPELAFIVQYALARWMIGCGILPSYMVGHGPGEYVAACISGVFGYEDCLRLLMKANSFSTKEEFAILFGSITRQAASIPFLSNNTGNFISEEQLASPSFWFTCLDKTSPSAASLQTLSTRETNMILVKIGAEDSDHFLAGSQTQKDFFPAVHLIRQEMKPGTDQAHLLAQVGLLWSFGLNIDWNLYYKEEVRKKIPLPTYSFEKIRYPTEFNLVDIFKEKGRLLMGTMESMTDWFYRARWKQSEWLRQPEIRKDIDQGILLVFLPFRRNREILSDLSAVMPENTVLVTAGASFEREGTGDFTINPLYSQHYLEVFRDLKIRGVAIARVIHLWSCEEASPTPGKEVCDNYNYYRLMGYDSLLEVVRAYDGVYKDQPLKLDVAGNGFYSVLGNERINAGKYMALGALKVIPMEFPHIKTRLIDVADTTRDSIATLIKELRYVTVESEIALRGNSRYIRDFEWIKGELPENAQTFRPEGTYLITGANGGMGRLFSGYLARDFKARLILVGRQERPEEVIRSLEEQGGKIIYIQSDITDVEKMGKSLEEAEKIFGEVNGVIHTAGMADHGGWILHRTRQDDENVFAAKIRGTEGLFSYFEDKDLDFFVNCSSLSTVVPAFGTVAYVAANSYLDAFATAKGRSYPMLSIAWCGLLEIGMATNGSQKTNVQETEFALRPAEAWNVLQRVIHLGMPNTLVSKIELNDFLKHYLYKFDDKNLAVQEQAIGEYIQERPLLSVLFEPPVTDTEKKLAAIWKSFFNLDAVGVKDDFFDLGGDSLQALIVCKRIHETLGVELFLSDLFQNPTIKDMAMKVEELLLPEMKLTKSIVI